MKVLVVDDDRYVRAVIYELLKNENYELLEAKSAFEALQITTKELPDLLVLDIEMPDNDGFFVCSNIRKHPEKFGTPLVLMLTSKTELDSITQGFEIGADDYLKKPFAEKELLLRVKALLRRKNAPFGKKYRYKDVIIDEEMYTVLEDGVSLDLSKKEFELLLFFVINKGIILSREKLMREVWQQPYFKGNKSVDSFIKKLKNKSFTFNKNIESVRGVGYLLKN